MFLLEESDYRSVFDELTHGKHRGESFVELLPEEVHVVMAGNYLMDLATSIPEHAAWHVPADLPAPALARDSLLFAGMLSIWKIIRLLEGFRSSWRPGALGFDGFAAAVILRAAMEESARLALAGRAAIAASELSSGRPAPDALLRLADRLLDSGEVTGLQETALDLGPFRAIAEALPSQALLFQGGQEAAKAIYGRLSTFVHAKGVARHLFRIQNFADTEVLTLRPSKSQSVLVMGAALGAYVYAAEVAHQGWQDLLSCAELMDALAAGDLSFALCGQPADLSINSTVELCKRGPFFEIVYLADNT